MGQSRDSNAIRVQSSEVLVPVMVLDEMRLAALRHMDPYTFELEVKRGDFGLWKNLAVRGLTAADFKVFEDGQEQSVQQVTAKPQSGPPLLRDNLGDFWDFLGVGGGTWTVPVPDSEVTSGPGIILPALPGYLVGYSPPPSPSGSCHQITVRTTRRQLLVYSRHEYCDTQISAADPLKGTKLEKQLASDMASHKKSQIPLSIATFALLTNAATIPLRIYLDFPSKPLVLTGSDCGEPVKGMIGVSGVVYSEIGNLAVHFSDFASQGTDSDHSFGPLMTLLPSPPGARCVYNEPARYWTEVSLPPGKYEVRVVLREGKKFGRVAIPVTLQENDATHLAISEIAVIKRFRDLAAGSQDTSTSLPVNFSPLLSRNFEVTPATNTRFHASDPFYFYLQVQAPESIAAANVKIRLRILDARTSKLVKQIEPVDAASYARSGDRIIQIAGGIDISKLPKGCYQLQAQATDSAGAQTPWRTANFTLH